MIGLDFGIRVIRQRGHKNLNHRLFAGRSAGSLEWFFAGIRVLLLNFLRRGDTPLPPPPERGGADGKTPPHPRKIKSANPELRRDPPHTPPRTAPGQ